MGVFSFLGLKTTSPGQAANRSGQTAYDFSFDKITGGALPLADFKNKVILVVNTASECGFTGQYEDLESLYQTYKDRGFVIIGVPSDDFGGQEPGSNDEILEFCESTFSITFPLTSKVEVVGNNIHPFYKWTSDVLGFGTRPKWNFHKYLIDANGNVIDYFNSTTNPSSERVVQAIEKLIASAS